MTERTVLNNPTSRLRSNLHGRLEAVRVEASKNAGVKLRVSQTIEFLIGFYEKHKNCGDTSRG